MPPQDYHDHKKGWGVRFNPEISLGTSLQALMFLIAGLLVFMGYMGKTDQTAQSMEKFRTDVSAQLTDMRATVNQQFRDVRTDIANLPDVKAELQQLDKRMDAAANHSVTQDAQWATTNNMAIQTQADVQNIIRSSAAAVGRH